MRILIVEDYAPLRRSLTRGLREAGYVVDATGDGSEGQWFLEEFQFDILVLDLMLPGMDGLSILRWLRKAERPTRVLILTARDAVEDKVRGLDLGADDYLVKPFAFDELLARINALARRQNGLSSSTVRLENLELDTRERVVRVDGNDLEFTPTEYALLELLLLRRGRVLSRDQIWEQLYDPNAEKNSNVIDVFVRAVRKKLSNAGVPELIRTRRGFGYTIEKSP
jgi:two-component system copper resistance phosphate regulon response regulator CusR